MFNWNAFDDIFNGTLVQQHIKHTPEGSFIYVSAPGLEKSDFKLNVDRDTLVVSWDQSDREDGFIPNKKGKCGWRLSKTALKAQENITATYTQGILKIFVPSGASTQQEETPFKIEVK